MNLLFKHYKKKLDMEKLQNCFEKIISEVATKSGVPRCVRFEDNTTVAFSGSVDEPDLILEVGIDTDDNLSASLDDEVSWNEIDFENTDAFVEEITNYIAPLVNHTVKYIKEYKKNKSIHFKRLVLDEEIKEWITLEDEMIDNALARPFITKDKIEEIIKAYCI